MTEVAKKRVLVVDDDSDLQSLVKVLLERIGLEAIPARTVAEAVAILRVKPLPDLVLLDLMLPDVSGMELLRQMRAKSFFDNLPVVILSALADPDRIREGLETGADRYLIKPFIAHNLAKTVNDVLRQGRRKVAE